MRKNSNKTNYHYKVEFADGSFKRFMTIKDMEEEYNISNFTIHKCIRVGSITRKCPEIIKFTKDYQPTFILMPNTL
jgi:hypothetical protein